MGRGAEAMKFNEPGRHKLVRQLFLAVGEARKAIL